MMVFKLYNIIDINFLQCNNFKKYEHFISVFSLKLLQIFLLIYHTVLLYNKIHSLLQHLCCLEYICDMKNGTKFDIN